MSIRRIPIQGRAMHEEPHYFPIKREALFKYFAWGHFFSLLVVSVATFGVGLVLYLAFRNRFFKDLIPRQVQSLRYWIDGTNLRVEGGVIFLSRLAIPLDRICDLMLVQGPWMRYFDIWALHVHTASSAHGPFYFQGHGQFSFPRATLLGLEDPERVRDEILKARDALRRSR